MLAERRSAVTFVIAIVVALALIVGGQYLAAATAPVALQSSQAKVIGQAGFAYIGGLRLMAAGLIWGRLDAQYHQFGQDRKIQDRLDLLPSVRIVQLLNPQLEQPYYFASYILYLRGKNKDALDLARQGIENNPASGLLRANYAQLLMIEDRKGNLPLMLEQAKAGLSKGVVYNNADDEFEAFGIFRAVYKIAGNTQMVKALGDAQKALEAQRTPQGSSAKGFFGMVDTWANSATNSQDGVAAPATSTAIVK